MTSREAWIRLGIFPVYLYQLLELGKIKGRKERGQWLIDRASVEQYAATSRSKRNRLSDSIVQEQAKALLQ